MLFLMFSSDVFPELSKVTTKGPESSVVVLCASFSFVFHCTISIAILL